jgi:hypothetical protein
MQQNMPDGSSKSYDRAEPSQPDSMDRQWADRDTVAHTCRAGEISSPGRGRRERDPWGERRGTRVLEAIMAGVVVVAIAVFIAGVVMGAIVVIAVAVHREDRRCTLAVDAPDRMSRTTRRLTGVGCRDLDAEFLRPAGQLVH